MLPIEHIKSSLISALERHSLVVLTAPPGAGKSTVLPLWLLKTAYAKQKVYLLQPRRVAAKNIACYLASQLGEPVGKTVGYRLRNESKCDKDTVIEVITEGILTQIIQQDPELAHCGLIIFDEFHERSVHADLAFALARDVQLGLRDDLTLLLMSATLATDYLADTLPEAKFVESIGRLFPVDLTYQAPKPQEYWRQHAITVIKQTLVSHEGSILVFLPGVADIKAVAEAVHDDLPANVILTPLYGDLSLVQQQQAIAPTVDHHKLVLATNIAETSLTIEGINLVIDCGFEKVAVYDNNSLTNRLVQQPISKASATQRAGRAGRLMAGHCIRLYSEEAFNRRLAQPVSDILQTDLLPVLIEAARWGVSSLADLPFIELPPSNKEYLAWQELIALNIVDENHKLTRHGMQAAKLPTHPRYASMIVSAYVIEKTFGVAGLAYLACILAALLEERDIFAREQAKSNADIRLRVDAFISAGSNKSSKFFKQDKQVKQLVKSLQLTYNLAAPLEYCGELLALAYPERIAKQRPKSGQSHAYLCANGKGVLLSEDDPLQESEFIVAANTMIVSNQSFTNQQFASLAAPVIIDKLLEWEIIQIDTVDRLEYDETRDSILAENQQCLGHIVLRSAPSPKKLDASSISQMWCDKVRKHGIAWLPLPEKAVILLERWRWLNQFQPQLSLPETDEASLLGSLDLWFSPFVGDKLKKSQLVKVDYVAALTSMLDYQQQSVLDKCAPTYFISPTNRRCKIEYGDNKHPMASLPMQEVYGQAMSPAVGDLGSGNGIPIVLELLSPAKRPLQVTQDLAAFWQGSYKDVQKEMKGRYPKHYWPDDPATAQATNKTKRHLKL